MSASPAPPLPQLRPARMRACLRFFPALVRSEPIPEPHSLPLPFLLWVMHMDIAPRGAYTALPSPAIPDDLRFNSRSHFQCETASANAHLCYFLPTNRILAVNARDCPPANAPKFGASILLTTVLGFLRSSALTASIR